MVLRVRVSLPDRPGVLGQVARAFGVLGADILQVTVLEREGGRAVDDFTVSWPGGFAAEELRERLSVVPGVRVEGAWPTREVPGTSPDYDLLGHVVTDAGRAFVTLVDAVPDLVSAQWAVAVDSATGEVVHGSWQAPGMDEMPDLTPLRPAAFSEGALHLLSLPVKTAGLHLVVARTEGAPFHQVEMDKVARVVEIVSLLATVDDDRTVA
ncbi:amino acid-binding protein [Sphaerisporangium sp. TRM90804]|uniref:amino acid-binding protein n=1 Tax=Sphaerisporangium sp. TRM90804 TaxID=3031113 RepID=UPI00244B8BCF|nr:amino acid-binding protein [Sphaerisporangium sp. TRM90804]MDH2429550.1 amino acid-binding protein [Sphaerisporangium sp. TRM90804]